MWSGIKRLLVFDKMVSKREGPLLDLSVSADKKRAKATASSTTVWK